MAVAFQRFADGADAPVHHVAGRHDVHTGTRMRQRLLHQGFDGDVIQHVAAVIDDAVLPVRGERVQGHIGDHAQFRETLLQRTHRALGQAIVVPGRFGIE